MKRYTDVLGVSQTALGARRVADIVAALAPPDKPANAGPGAALVKTEQPAPPTAGKAALSLAPGVGGAAVGAFFWKKHRILGALAGHALGSVALPLVRGSGNERKRALCQLGVEGAGVGGSLLWSRHRILGWLAGLTAGAVATAFVPGSTANDEYHKWKNK